MIKSILIGIILTAAVLRLWNLSNIPPSASLDEASIAYNAYSVIKTGGDEFGQFPLISQRGYDDWRRSTYLLLSIPFVAVFGLTTTAIRLPAVILSIISVIAVYLIALEFTDRRNKFSYILALLSSFIIAISPWHIYISRLGHESNTSLSFLILGILFFLKGLKKSKLMILSVIFFILSMISYYSGQIIVPLFVFGLLILFRKKLYGIITSNKKTLAISISLFAVIVPITWSLFSPDALIRYRGTSLFSSSTNPEKYAQIVNLRNEAVKNNDIIGSIFFNRRVYFSQLLVTNYISHFKPDWLLSAGKNDAFKAPYTGLLYAWQIPFFLIGVFALIFSKRINSKFKVLIILWFLIGPLPASIATQAPHAMRAYNMLPVWGLFTALGIAFVFERFKKFTFLLIIGLGSLIIIGLLSFLENYYVEFPKYQSKSYQYALSRVIPYVVENQGKYDKIVFSNYDNLFQSYMLFLYHSKYDPILYQKQGGTISGGFDQTHSFGKFEFRPINWIEEDNKNVLYIANPDEIPESEIPILTGTYLDGKTGVVVVSK